ncbi:MAG: hypothetical protein QW186_07485 [Candidatus Bathyarchaeia archaeon]
MIESERRGYYKALARVRRAIGTRLLRIKNPGPRFLEAVMRKGLTIRIMLFVAAFNTPQIIRGNLVGTRWY